MAKMIKFDLLVDGTRVSTLDDLQDHFTTEVIEHFRSGLLARWLRARGLERELAGVEALTSDNDAYVLKQLSRIFKVEADEETIAWAIGQSKAGVPGTHLKNAALAAQLAKRILDLDLDMLSEALRALEEYQPPSWPITDLPRSSPIWNIVSALVGVNKRQKFSRFRKEFRDVQELARKLLEHFPSS